MLSVNPNPAHWFSFFDPMNMGPPGLTSPPPSNSPPPPPATATFAGAGSTSSSVDDLNKKIRKPYTITKSRENWTDQEHDKFLEALQLFDRDWKKIEAFVGSKTVIQIRSHAQKYFLKVQKSGTSEHVPPPRPKRKASHPYPQKAPKNALVASQVADPFQSKSALLGPDSARRTDSSSVLGNPITSAASWSFNTVPPVCVSQVTKDDAVLVGPTVAQNCCYTSGNDSTHLTLPVSQPVDWGNHGKPTRVMPDFAEVYSFIGSVFDPNASGHLQKLKQMEPINLETVSLLMSNLSFNLTSPEFEDHRRLLSSYDIGSGSVQPGSTYNNLHAGKSEGTAPAW